MSDNISLTAELREDVGKGASRRLRRSGQKVPAIIYGASKDPQNLTLAVNELSKAMSVEAFYSQIIDVSVEGGIQQAVVRDLQRNPASGKVQHIDFQRISANQAMHVSVPLHFINEENCHGVKMEGGLISHNMQEVEVSCLPADLPEFLEIDVIDLAVGGSLHLSDIKLPSGVTIIALSHGDDHDLPIVAVSAPRAAVEEDLDGPVEAPEADDAEEEEGGDDSE